MLGYGLMGLIGLLFKKGGWDRSIRKRERENESPSPSNKISFPESKANQTRRSGALLRV